jgi:hypothetical protein
MVIRLAESLELTLGQRNDLLRSAGYAAVYTEYDYASTDLRPVRAALDAILAGHDPYPAVVARSNGEIVAVNEAMEVIFEDIDAELLRAPTNTFRIALRPNGMAPRILNFEAWAQHVIKRASLQRSPKPDHRNSGAAR